MDSMAASTVPILRFLLCFAATIPLSFLSRLLPHGLPKHLYSASVGVTLSDLSFGFSSNLHYLVPMLLGYASMLLYRPRCGLLAFFFGFGYLIGWILCAVNYNDGLLKEEGLRDAQKNYRLIKLPSLIEYVGYCLCCGTHFADPVYEMKEYLHWAKGKAFSVPALFVSSSLAVPHLKIWSSEAKGPSPSPYGATIRALLQTGFCMAMYLKLMPHFPLSKFTDPTYHEWGFWRKLGYQYMAGFTARWKYYFIWSISEASMIISGLGFSGWTGSSPPKPHWDRAKNVDILGIEFAKSAVVIPAVWNIQVSTWLRHYYAEFAAMMKKGDDGVGRSRTMKGNLNFNIADAFGVNESS
ncbi:hypothetical protein RJT34_10983 [Clitoria ternatea]|uniref:Uncharacterized protein n=1 Tax=Clitoria ternatea TaxID=43366 RepID=A0AAN9JJ64_CLITE